MASTGSPDRNPRPRQRTRRPYGAEGWCCPTQAVAPCQPSSTASASGSPHVAGLSRLSGCSERVPRRVWVEPVTGLEPASPPWEGGVLTLGRYRHMILVRRGPSPPRQRLKEGKYEVRRYICAPGGWPRSIMEGGVGFEPHTELVPASAAPCPPVCTVSGC